MKRWTIYKDDKGNRMIVKETVIYVKNIKE